MTDPINHHTIVGRGHELALADAIATQAILGRSQILLISGEPGIGKTRLAQAIESRLLDLHFNSLWGTCPEESGVPSYWPWIQILRQQMQASNNLVSVAGAVSSNDLLPFLPPPTERPLLLQLHHPVEAPVGEQARNALFDNLIAFFGSLAASTPLLIILDDLHRADDSSLLLLRCIVQELRYARLLIVGTLRERDADPNVPPRRILRDIERAPNCRHLQLCGLPPDDLAKLIETELGQPSPANWISCIQTHSEGNPFFAKELARLLCAQQGARPRPHLIPPSLPDTIREVITQRAQYLSASSRNVLRAASTIGRTFDLALLQKLTRVPMRRLVHLLNEAEAAAIIVRTPDLVGQYRFEHALTCRVMYDSLPAVRRMRLHRQIASYLDASESDTPASDAVVHLLAHHYYEALPLIHTSKAVDYCLQAARLAEKSLAYEDAILYYRRAADALQLGDLPHDHHLRCSVLLSLGQVYTVVGSLPEARETYLEAAFLARAIAHPDDFARAALGYGWESRTGFVDTLLVDLLEEALRLLPTDPSPLRVAVLARLSRALYWATDRHRALTLSQEALQMSRVLKQPDAQAIALTNRYVALWGPDGEVERNSLISSLDDLARDLRDDTTTALFLRFGAMQALGNGELSVVGQRIDAYARLAAERKSPFLLAETALLRGMLAMLGGAFLECRAYLTEARQLADRLGSAMLAISCWAQEVALCRVWGSVNTLLPALRDLVHKYPALRVWRAAHVNALSRTNPSVARVQLAHFFSLPTDSLPRDGNWLTTLALLSEAAWFLREASLAKTLYELLSPYKDRIIVIGYAAACDGSLSHYLGLLASLLGSDAAAVHFSSAISTNQRLGSLPLVARTKLEYAQSLLQNPVSDDYEAALQLLREASHAFTSLDMGFWAQRAASLRRYAQRSIRRRRAAQQSPPVPTTSVPPPPTVGENRLYREGDYWTFEYEGRIIRLAQRRGIEQLAYLIARPGTEVPATVLASLQKNPDGTYTAELPVHREAATPVIDSKALRSYMNRLKHLREQLDEAEAYNDTYRATRAREEIDALRQHLSASLRKDGRPRLMSILPERHRVSVRNNIALALKHIQQHDPGLWRHLQASLRTGALCCYQGDPPIAVRPPSP